MTKTADFNLWNTVKQERDTCNVPKQFEEGTILWTSVGVNVGKEINGDKTKGKDVDFVRPVLVLRKYGKHTFLGIPLTTQSAEKIAKYPDFFYTLGKRKNGISCLALTQIRIFSANRLLKKETSLSGKKLKHIRAAVTKIL